MSVSVIETEFISRQTVVVFSCRPTAAEDWCNGFHREKVREQQKTHGPYEGEHSRH